MSILPQLICAVILMKCLIGQESPLNITTAIYQKFNIKPVDCPDVYSARSKSHCAVSALGSDQAFKYFDRVCTKCVLGSNLTFSSEEFYVPRMVIVSSRQVVDLDDFNTEFNLSKPLTPGTLIYLAVTPLGDESYLELNRDPVTCVFHMYIRFNWDYFGFNSMVNGNWQTEKAFTPIHPFVKGQRTDVHILVTQDRYVIYLNQVYCCEYLFVLPVTDVKVVHFLGTSFVHELSL